MEKHRRHGPRPLSAHIGLSVSAAHAAGTAEALPAMLRGMHLYQNHPYAAPAPVYDTLWQAGSVRVLKPRDTDDVLSVAPAALLVPSLINTARILDLLPDRSMLRWLRSRGIDAYLLDWGDVTKAEGQATMEDMIAGRLCAALDFLKHHAGQSVHGIGYCMGGTMLAGAAVLAAHALASLTFLAAPWDFAAGDGALRSRVAFWAPGALPAMAAKNVLPVEWTQTLFASLDPAAIAAKFVRFADMDQDSGQACLFIAVEDWLNDGVDLPAALSRECIQGWFLENAPAAGAWVLRGHAVMPENINVPCLVVASSQDKLVEFGSAMALARQLQRVQTVDPVCGHIGMVAGRQSVERVWRPIVEFIKGRDG